jgi:hypothetical protein
VGHNEVGEWSTGGTKSSRSHREKPRSIGVKIHDPTKSEVQRDKGPSKIQLTCASVFRCIRYRGLETQVFDIASCEVAIR